MKSQTDRVTPAGLDAFDGLVTGIVSCLAAMALDDITTDTSSTAFTAEWGFLVIAAAWGGVLTLRLARRGRRTLAVLSGLFLVAALWGQQWVGPGITPGWRAEYVALAGALVGFGAIALTLLALALRAAGPARHNHAVGRDVGASA